MHLISHHPADADARLGVVAGDHVILAANLLPGGPLTIDELLERGESGVSALRQAADADRISREGQPLTELRLLAPVPRPGKIVAIGRNYADHAAEDGATPPLHR